MASPAPRPARRDIVIAAVLSALGALLMYDNVVRILRDGYVPGSEESAAIHFDGLLPPETAIPLFLLVTGPVAWRRVAPLPATAAALAGLLLNELLVGSEYLRCGVALPVALLLAFAAGAQLGLRPALLALALAVVLTAVDFAVSFGWQHAVVFGVVTVAFWGIGRVARSRRRMVDELELRTAELRAARDERARLKVMDDRLRLSRELDELLQERLGELARLAEGAAANGGPAATLIRIEHESRRTLERMRELVGVLRHEDGARPAPTPALAHLETLLAHMGDDARLEFVGTPRVLPAGVELAAYRVVEHLLAAVADAPGLVVQVRFADDGLGLTVTGPAGRRGKAAVERARQRVQLHRGTLESAVRGGRAEAVVWLPIVAGA